MANSVTWFTSSNMSFLLVLSPSPNNVATHHTHVIRTLCMSPKRAYTFLLLPQTGGFSIDPDTSSSHILFSWLWLANLFLSIHPSIHSYLLSP
jgi:hypothetical protein